MKTPGLVGFLNPGPLEEQQAVLTADMYFLSLYMHLDNKISYFGYFLSHFKSVRINGIIRQCKSMLGTEISKY